MTLAWLLVQFALCALLIARAGFVLSRSADRLAELYGWGRGWVGLALLASVTSLPELASGISAVAFVDAPNLAVGNALGACVVNLVFLVIVDAMQRHQPMYREAGTTHLLSAGFGVVMLGLVALSLLVGTRAPSLFQVGAFSPLLLGLYLLALRSVQAHEQRALAVAAPLPDPAAAPAAAVQREWRSFGLAAAAVVAAGAVAARGRRPPGDRAASVAQLCRHPLHGAGDHAAGDGGHACLRCAWARWTWPSATCSAATCSTS